MGQPRLRPQLAHHRRRLRRLGVGRRVDRGPEAALPLLPSRRVQRPRHALRRPRPLQRLQGLAPRPQRAVHPHLALGARRLAADDRLRHDEARRVHPLAPHQRRGARHRPGPARARRRLRGRGRRLGDLGAPARGRLHRRRPLQQVAPRADGRHGHVRARHGVQVARARRLAPGRPRRLPRQVRVLSARPRHPPRQVHAA